MSQELQQVAVLPRLAPRPADSNKGMFGKVLVVAGSVGMSGAAILTGTAALRSGAGLVRVATAREMLPVVAGGQPSYMTVPLPQDDAGHISLQARDILQQQARASDVLAVGPGLGRSEDLTALLTELVQHTTIPLVLDADGLNAFAGQANRLRQHAGPRILTPHPGEFARLLQTDIATVQQQRRELAARFAHEHQLIVVLKGSQTIVTDGRHFYENTTGNPGMATGGSGDVLTGVIAALLGQHLEPFAAAQLGVYVHGLAGDLARQRLGEVGPIASDLLACLPTAFQQL